MSDTRTVPATVESPMRRAEDPAKALGDIRNVGGWMVWTSVFLACLWWVACGIGAFALTDLPALMGANLPLIIAGAIAAFIPGALIITAGYMARENRRAAATNALVMRAASRLLTPSREIGEEASDLAGQLQQSAASVDRAMGHAISAMKALAGELGDERMRLESVSYASADNARDLSDRLAQERTAMETLARELKQQTDGITDAIPRQSKMMVDAARMAGEELAKSELGLDERLGAMARAGEALHAKLADLDRLAADAAQRTESITYAVTRVEEKLEQSRKTVDAAVRAGEMAAAAASTTGDSLKDAVSSALSGAREATGHINADMRRAAEETAQMLAQLRDASADASGAIRTAGMAARAETDMIERRIDLMAGSLGRIGKASNLSPAPDDARPATFSPTPKSPARAPADAPAIDTRAADDVGVPPRAVDDELFDGRNGAAIHTNGHDLPQSNGADDTAPSLMLRTRMLSDDALSHAPPLADTDAFDPLEAAPPPDETTNMPAERSGNGAAPTSQTTDGSGWKNFLAEMDEPAAPIASAEPPETTQHTPASRPREETAEEVVERLQTSGIQLPQTFRPKDKRKIAAAARKSERQRRTATLEAASRQVERVAQRLQSDAELNDLARDFIAMEEADALVALQETQKTGRNASPRLSAYLLIDAALG